MSYTSPRWPKFITGTIAVGMIATIIVSFNWHFLKESYFNHISASCSETHGLERIPWKRVLAFDVDVHEFTARDRRELATLECIDRWAGAFIADDVASDIVQPTIQLQVRGGHYAPPERLVSYYLTRPTN